MAGTAYQNNLAQPTEEKKQGYTTRDAYRIIAKMSEYDMDGARDLYSRLMASQQDSSSKYYNPYAQPTNRAVSNLQSYGFDTSNLNDDWFNQNQGWISQHLQYNGTTNTPSKPGKKASWEQNVAYELYQWNKSEATTKKAEQEWAALQEELAYWAKDQSRNYSDDEIMNRIDWSKYKTLASMDENKYMSPTELNRGIDYSKDAMYGVLWAARNPEYNGDMFGAIANSALGTGNQWIENPVISAKLNKSDLNTYSPYSVGMTLEEEGLYFGVNKFDRQTLDDIRANLDWNDETAVKYYQNVEKAYENTQQAQRERDLFMENLQKKLSGVTDPEKARKIFDQLYNGTVYDKAAKEEVGFNTLRKMDDSLVSTNLLPTTDAVDWKKEDILNYALWVADQNKNLKTGAGVVNDYNHFASAGVSDTPVSHELDMDEDTVKANDKPIKDAKGFLTDEDDGTAESNMLNNAGSSIFTRVIGQMKLFDPVKVFTNKAKEIAAGNVMTSMNSFKDYDTYVKSTNQLQYVNAELEDLMPKAEAINALGSTDVHGYSNLISMTQDEEWQDFLNTYYENDGVLMHPTAAMKDPYMAEELDRAYQYIYQHVYADDPTAYGVSDMDTIREKASQWWDILQNSNDLMTPEEAERYEQLTSTKASLEKDIERTADAYADYNRSTEATNGLIQILDSIGVDTTELRVSSSVGNYLNTFADYEKTEWEAYNAYDMMMQGVEGGASYEEVSADAAEGNQQIEEALENLNFVKEYVAENGIEIPDEFRKNMDRYEAKLKRSLTDYGYFTLQGEKDFKEQAETGRTLEEKNKLTGNRSNEFRGLEDGTEFGLDRADGYDLMTETEKNTFYYLYATKGYDAAADYYKYLADPTYGVLQVRYAKQVQAGAEAEVNSGFFGGLWANTKAILSAPISSIASLAYMGGSLITGEELNPYNSALTYNRYASAVNQATMESIEKVYEKDPTKKAILGGLYEMAYNRGRSLANSLASGGLTNGINNSILQELVGASPMAFSAMMDSIMDAKERGADDTQAWLIGAATFFAEDFTEGLTYGNIRDTITGSPDEIITGFKNLVKNWLTSSGVEEMFGEVASDWIGNKADEWIMKELSNHAQRVETIKSDNPGISDEEAEVKARQEEMEGYLHTAIISYLSAGLDIPVSTAKSFFHEENYARKLAKKYRENGIELNMSSIRKEYHEYRQEQIATENKRAKEEAEAEKEAKKEKKQKKGAPKKTSTETGTAPIAAKQLTPEQQTAQAISGITASQGGDSEANTAAIAAAFNGEEGTDSGDMAMAASTALPNLFGKSAQKAATAVKNILIGATNSGTDLPSVKQAMQTGALSASSEARRVMTSPEFARATGAEQAAMLAGTVEADQNNQNVQRETQQSIYDARVEEATKPYIQAGEYAGTEKAQDERDAAEVKLRTAEKRVEEAQDVVNAKSDAVVSATEAIAQDPSPDNRKIQADALSALNGAVTAQEQAEWEQEEAQKDLDNKQNTLNDVRSKERASVYQKAQADVEAENQQRTAEAEQRQLAIRAEQEQKTALNESEAAEEQNDRANLENAVRERLSSVYSGEELERQVARVMEFANQGKRKKVNTRAKLSEKDGDKFLRMISRQTGITYEMQDLGDPYKKRGYIVDRNHIVLNSNLTRGQALVEAALHEVTHGIEETKAYENYATFVLNAMYGENTEQYEKDIATKLSENAPLWADLSDEEKRERARQELVADYARLNLGKKEFVRGLTARGLGAKFMDLLTRAVSMMKGYTLDAEGRAKYQEMRAAMKLLKAAIDERAQHVQQSNNGHTGLVQASISGWTNATGLTLEVTDDDSHVYRLLNNGEEIKPGEYKADMVKGTPVGNLIDMAGKARIETLTNKLERGKITLQQYNDQIAEIANTANQQREYVAQIINMIGQYQDAAMVWELAGSLAFSSLKTNGDPQYSDSYDFGTICTKTQAILNVISQTQVDLGRALTKEEIDGIVYEEVGKGVQDENGKWVHGATPCPPCYVYATWVNKPARLEKVRVYQNECVNWSNEQINEFMNRPDPVGKTKSETNELKTEQNTRKLWISLCFADQVTDPTTGEKTWVRKENPDICPNEILLDLRRSGDMATQHPGTWAFMQRGGNSQGKAIAPYSDARLGETIVAKSMGAGVANARLLEDARNEGNPDYIPQFLNPFLSSDPNDMAKAEEYFNNAIKKVKAQNLKGGQRWQSWSDFRAEWGSDYLMEMITMQALGSQVQTYTKVVEALDLLASAGFEVNMSLMPHGDGFWHNEDGSIKIDEDGNMMLRFSPVTGINPEAAAEFAKKYGNNGNVQPMVVGISDEHIKAALAGDFITFVIPFHGSGGSVKRLQHLMSLLHEQMATGNDYTKAQSDKFEEGSENTNPNWALRVAILTGADLTDEQIDAINENPYLKKLYEDRYLNEDSDAFEVFFSNSEAQQIYPYEYWDTNTTLATADVNSRRFIEYCQMMGVIPRFSGLTKTVGKGKNAQEVEYANFSGRSVDKDGNVTYNPVKGYWKLLIDRSMYNRVYDENGKIIPEQCTYHKPQAVSTANINVGAMPMAANNTVGHSDDDTRQITERVIQRVEMESGQNAAAGSAVDLQQNAETLNKTLYEGANVQNSNRVNEQNSLLGDLSDNEMDMILRDIELSQSGNNQNSGIPAIPTGLPGRAAVESGPRQRQFGSRTAQESDALHGDVKEYLYRHSAYTPDSNQEQIDRSIDWVRGHANQADPDGFFGAMQEAQRGDFDAISADGQARMLTLMSMAAIKGEQTGDHSAELLLADMFNKQGTEAGRALQARKMFRLMTPVGRMATLNRMAEQINEEYGKKGSTHRVRLSQELLNEAAEAESEEDFAKVRKKAKQELAAQMPANWKEKFGALRMLAMLGNIRTHGRNILGNLAFMPAVGLKNKIGAAIESAFVKTGERTKTIGLATPEAKAFAKRYSKQIESLLRGESKYNEGNSVQRERKMFGQGKGVVSKTLGRATQWLIDKNGNALEGEDWIFLNRHFRNALAGYMTANNLTEADMKGDTLDKATAYAVNEAQKATYRDANEIANWMNSIKNPVAKFVINAILPFKKTPMNILKRGVEYSPVSIIRSLTSDAKHLKEWDAYQRGELTVLPEKAISPTQYIDRLAAGLSGTAFLAVGALLSALGFLKGGMDDDDDEFDKLNGSQEYSLEIGGVSFTIDWAAPICMPLFVGATIMDEARKAAENKGDGISVGSVLDAILGISEPVTQLSMLDGLNSVLNPSNYGNTDGLVQVGEKVLTNYATSYVPTLFGQIARTIDTTRRKNYVESGADLKTFRSAWEQVENKIPFLSKTNIPYRNVWGEADVSPTGWAAIENFLSPGYGNVIKDDPVTNELKRLYHETKDPNMIPKAAGKTISINGKSTPLTAEQYDQYVVDRGQTAHESIKMLMDSPAWQFSDDQTRAMMVTDAWSYANQIARHNIDNSTKKESWIANAEYNGNFVETVIDRAANTNRKEYITGYGQVMAEAMDSNDSEMYELSIAAMDNADATEAEIRAPLRDYFKPRYQQAFEDQDEDTMDEIMEKLLDAGVGFKEKDIRSWLPSEEDEMETDYRWLNEESYER